MRFRVKIQGLDKVKSQLEKGMSDVRKVCENEVQAAAQDWVQGAQRDAPVDQNKLRGAISFSKTTGLSAEIVAQVFYAPFIEFGTKGKYRPISGTESIAAAFKGYKGGDFMALLRNILRWVKRKGITGTYSAKTKRRQGSKVNQYAEDYSAAWPIALSILRNGINPHPFFFKQAEIVWPAMVKRMQARLKQATKVTVTSDVGRPNIEKI
jgi:hypothetical protein